MSQDDPQQISLDLAKSGEAPVIVPGGQMRERLLALSVAPGLGAERAIAAAIADPAVLDDPTGLPTRLRAAWRAGLTHPDLPAVLAAERAALATSSRWWRTPADPDWPASWPPRGVLRGVGVVPPPGLAIVGARRADPYGRELAARIARAAVDRGLAVISGGAFGIDHAAHSAALDAGGHTVVVLGAGLDHASPKSHRRLFERAAAQGAVVSPFPCGLPGDRWTFPRRNAWIAALAQAVVVVQAGAKSGALHTARAAFDLGRPVWAAPGPLDAPLHAGCHALINSGAHLLTAHDAWAADLGLGATSAGDEPLGEPSEGLALWRATGVEPRTIEAIADEAGVPFDEAAVGTTLLELEGWLVACPGGRYRRGAPRR